ncbi:site-specific recombinase, phage integrase family [gamma proteobacterium IMCC1989]|nr:site-specific recombinase, phage integrase family [gamma proteobacterium IMCC1989]
MKLPKPIPLYPTYNELKDIELNDYPELNTFLNESSELDRLQHWRWGLSFLNYIGRNKSEHTYNRFRNEVERFLTWVFMVKMKPIDILRKQDILEYVDFCWKPPVSFIGLAAYDRFVYHNGFYKVNPKWLPFRVKTPKGRQSETGSQADKKKYKPSQETLKSLFTGVVAFYKYLMSEEVCYGNPAQIAKSDCRYFIADAQVKDIRRLTEDQWQYVLDIALTAAENNDDYERSLFVIASLKTLFLRISELSERKDWSPEMRHFWQDEQKNWWLKVYGKGRKLRDVSVPTQYLGYLKRYRQHRALSALPSSSDISPIVEKIRGQGGMTTRHLTRLVQEIFDKAYEKMKLKEGEDAARKLQEASTHWLRHTGASMEIERGRALKDLSEDLGHASMATTDTIYVQSENKKRAASGKDRNVE